jgi:hypothetical protein
MGMKSGMSGASVDRGYWREELKTKDHLEDTGVDGRIIFQ